MNNKGRDFKIGEKINDLEIISLPFIENGYRKIYCKCKCGKTIKKYTGNIERNISCRECKGVKDRKYTNGSKLNSWTIVDANYQLSNNKQRMVVAKCGFCGNEKIVTIAQLHFSQSCGCLSHLVGSDNKRWKGGKYIPGSYFSRIKHNAKKRKLQFDLDIVFLDALYEKQNKKCAISGLDISFDKNEAGTASLDRRDSKQGYTQDNVQWVHKDVNKIKSDMDYEKFLLLCEHISCNGI